MKAGFRYESDPNTKTYLYYIPVWKNYQGRPHHIRLSEYFPPVAPLRRMRRNLTLNIPNHSVTIRTAPNLFRSSGGFAMNDQVILFSECQNLNSEGCEFTQNPHKILSLFSDPENFFADSDKIQELNNHCFECAWFQRKPQ